MLFIKKSETVVQTVVLGVIVDTSPRGGADAAAGKQDLPDWLQPFTGGLVEGESGSSGGAGEQSTSSAYSTDTLEQIWMEAPGFNNSAQKSQMYFLDML